MTLGIIDDRNQTRRSFARKLYLEVKELDSKWEVLDIEPFIEKEDYVQWILENNISALIIDERLYEEETDCGNNISYSGHQLVEFLRIRFKDLPLYIITNVAISADVKKIYNQFNLILGKREFDEKLKDYLNLIIMSGNKFFNNNQMELERLSYLSEKIIDGKASNEEISEAKALQLRLVIPHTTESNVKREDWLKELGELVTNLDGLSSDIKQFLEEK